jgi:hypothetical protein
MKLFEAVPMAACVVLLGATLSTSAKADDWNNKTTVTFSAPVEIPGVHLRGWGTLPPGTYVFKLLDSKSDRNIVQIFNKDETVIYATILAIPNYRLKATNKTVMTFNEGIRGRPEAIRAWFYPGANWGQEFVYPKTKAVELAKVTKLPVLTITAALPLEVEKPEEPAVVVQLQQAPIMAVKPTGEVVEVAEVIQTTAPETSAPAASPVAAQQAPTLPATASSFPLLALFGFLALGGAIALRSAANRAR